MIAASSPTPTMDDAFCSSMFLVRCLISLNSPSDDISVREFSILTLCYCGLLIHWSISSTAKNTALQKALLEGVYKRQALVPASPWLDATAPDAPTVTTAKENDKLKISWTHNNSNDVFRWVVYYRYADRWEYTILTHNESSD